MLDEFPGEGMAGVRDPGSQLAQLVLRVLAFVVSRDSRIDRDAHRACLQLREKGLSIRSGGIAGN
jgi:hypothetical protein